VEYNYKLNYTKKKDIKDNSGFKMYVTQNYRKNEFGVLVAGMNSHWNGATLPPGGIYDMNYGCSTNCTDVNFINLIYSNLN
jgi:hypothetical protein